MKKFSICERHDGYCIQGACKTAAEADSLKKELSLSPGWSARKFPGTSANGTKHTYHGWQSDSSVLDTEIDKLYKLSGQARELWTPLTPEQLEERRRKAEEWHKEHGDHPTQTVKEHEETKRNPYVPDLVRGRTIYAPIDECENPLCPIVKLTKTPEGKPSCRVHHALGVAKDDTEKFAFRLDGYCHDSITDDTMDGRVWNQALLDMVEGKIQPRQPGRQPATWTPLAPVLVVESKPIETPVEAIPQPVAPVVIIPTEYSGPALRFNVCDLNAIETRVGAWLADCHDLMAVFEPWTDPRGVFKPNGKCPYLSFGSKMYGITFDKLYADYEGWNGKEAKGDAKRKRQVAKPGVLGAIYRLSGGILKPVIKRDEKTNEILYQYNVKTGLWDYADKMGVEMSQEQAHQVVEIFRNSYPEICSYERNPDGSAIGIWTRLEDAVLDVMDPAHPATVRYIGPNDCVRIDRVNIVGRAPMMRMQLPSGRYLHYLDAQIKPTKMPWTGEDDEGNEIEIFRDSLVYAGTNQKTKQWEVGVTTHGGKLFENLVQGIARDILGAKLLAFEAAGMPVVGHVHDEGITLVVDDLLSPTYRDMVTIMSTPEAWAPGLLLGADGYEDPYYHK